VLPAGYPTFFADVKARIAAARTRAVLAVNSELIRLYWEIGHEILERQDREGWGAGVTKLLSVDLRREFADRATAITSYTTDSDSPTRPQTRSTEAPRPRAIDPPQTCADATQNTTPIVTQLANDRR
jgi:DUF1016 N-terminal domain